MLGSWGLLLLLLLLLSTTTSIIRPEAIAVKRIGVGIGVRVGVRSECASPREGYLRSHMHRFMQVRIFILDIDTIAYVHSWINPQVELKIKNNDKTKKRSKKFNCSTIHRKNQTEVMENLPNAATPPRPYRNPWAYRYIHAHVRHRSKTQKFSITTRVLSAAS